MTTRTHNDAPTLTGTYEIDPSHSSAGFGVQHGGISTFSGGFHSIEGRLDAGPEGLELRGAVAVDSIDVELPDLRGHLLSEEFFNAQEHPEVEFRSTSFSVEGDEVAVTGELTLAGVTREVSARGVLRGPAPGLDGADRLGLELRSDVDRSQFGLDWQAELPGGGEALGYTVSIEVALELVEA